MDSPPRGARPLARADVVLVPFSFTDLSSTKRRPAIVVAVDRVHSDLVLAFVSSQQIGRGELGDVSLLPGHPEFSLTGLTVPSKVRTGKLVTLSMTMVRRWLGRLGPLLIGELDRALVLTLEINTVMYREEGRRTERARLVTLHGAGGPGAVLSDLGVS